MWFPQSYVYSTFVHTVDAIAPPCHWIDSTHFLFFFSLFLFFFSFFRVFSMVDWIFVANIWFCCVCSCACVCARVCVRACVWARVCVCVWAIVLIQFFFFVLRLIFLATLTLLTHWMLSIHSMIMFATQFNAEYKWNIDPKQGAREITCTQSHNTT